MQKVGANSPWVFIHKYLLLVVAANQRLVLPQQEVPLSLPSPQGAWSPSHPRRGVWLPYHPPRQVRDQHSCLERVQLKQAKNRVISESCCETLHTVREQVILMVNFFPSNTNLLLRILSPQKVCLL